MIRMDIKKTPTEIVLKGGGTDVGMLGMGETLPVITQPTIIQKSSYLSFPTVGKTNTLYIDTSKNKGYYWHEEDMYYYIVATDYNDIEIINGGSALDTEKGV